jgi:hypothetical protein
MNTTLNQIRSKSPCADGWTKLLKHLGKTQADDEPLSLTTILDSNGLEDALWCLQAVDGHAREIRLYTVWCARQVQHLTKDQRSIDALDVAERFANGQATKNELDIAGDAAGAAAGDAAGAAGAAGAAVRAARDAARAAAGAAGAAVRDAARAVRAAARAVRAAAGDAAGAAVRAAAVDAAGAAQEVKFREMFCDILETKELKEKNTNLIRRLEKQCWDYQSNCVDAEKFTQLIVAECVTWVNDNLGMVDEEARADLLKHFGVEE